MQKTIKKILPTFVKAKIARHVINLDFKPSPQIKIKAAETIEELDQAYNLLGQVYQKEKYCDLPKRVLPYNTSKNSATFIAVKKNKVIGTVSIFADSTNFKLPLDSICRKKIDEIRKKEKSIAEISGLAIEETERKTSQKLVMQLNKILFEYLSHKNISNIIIGVNPKHVHIYKGLFLFKPLDKEKKNYDFVNNAPVIPLILDIEKTKNYLKKIYNNKPDNKNIYKFFFNSNNKHNFTKNTPAKWNKKTWEYFIDDLIRNSPKKRKSLLLSMNNS